MECVNSPDAPMFVIANHEFNYPKTIPNDFFESLDIDLRYEGKIKTRIKPKEQKAIGAQTPGMLSI